MYLWFETKLQIDSKTQECKTGRNVSDWMAKRPGAEIQGLIFDPQYRDDIIVGFWWKFEIRRRISWALFHVFTTYLWNCHVNCYLLFSEKFPILESKDAFLAPLDASYEKMKKRLFEELNILNIILPLLFCISFLFFFFALMTFYNIIPMPIPNHTKVFILFRNHNFLFIMFFR